jgi:TfoX/Sxy family transcriptional regulator of competence genes
MKAWKRTPPEIVAAFDKALPASPAVIRRPMFGYASAFVNGNMFAGTFQDAIVVRLAVADRDALLEIKARHPSSRWVVR